MTERVCEIAQKLKGLGFSRGDRISVLSQNQIELYYFVLACWKVGVVAVPVSTRYPEKKLRDALDSIHCKGLIVARSMQTKMPESRLGVLEDYLSMSQCETTSLTFDQLDFDLEQEASILFTSGSDGIPKGVLHTIGNHYYSALGALENIPFREGDRWLMSLPMYHISGFSLVMRSLINGGTIVFPEKGQSICDAILKKNITHLSLVPVQLTQLMQTPDGMQALGSCKSILLGGSSASPSLVKMGLDQGLRLSATYGSTELASQVATTTPETLKEHPDVSGEVLAHRELLIAADKEILTKGPTLFKGYVSKDGLELPLDGQGYFHMGDLGTLDKNGHLFVIGRKDRMFISGGENIYPEEIERAIFDMDSFEQVHVVSVPDAVMGQRPVAFLKMNPSAPPLSPEAIATDLKTRLEGFKIPVSFLPWPEAASGSIKPDGALLRSVAIKSVGDGQKS